MQIKALSPRQIPTEQEYNFRVKVNHNNGAVTVHGPTVHTAPPALTPLISPSHFSINYAPIYPQQLPIIRQNIPINQPYPRYSAPFSIATASHSQLIENEGMKNLKTNSDTYTDVTSVGNQSVQRHRSSQPLFKTQVQKQRKVVIASQEEQEIDCVICQKKFRAQDFQYHLELHRNSRRKTQEVSSAINPQRKITQQQKQIQSQHSIQPDLLYSFHNNNSIHQQQSIHSQHSLLSHHRHHSHSNQQSHRNQKIIETNQQPLLHSSQNSSIAFDNKSRNSSMMKDSQVLHMQSGIRYIGAPGPHSNSGQVMNSSGISGSSKSGSGRISLSQASQQPVVFLAANSPIIYGSNHSQPVSSVRSSQILTPQLPNPMDPRSSQSSHRVISSNHENQQLQQPHNQSQQTQRSKQQSVNPFELIQQEQSKVYEYFPNSGHYTLSQHRVNSNPVQHNNNVSYQFPEPNQNMVKQSRQTIRNHPQNHLHFTNTITNNNNEQQDNRSQLSESSISSIRSLTQPLEDMSRDKILRAFHNPKRRINLSNIIGMSEVLAREGVTNHANSITMQQQMAQNSNINRNSSNNFKVISAKSMILSPEEQANYKSQNAQNTGHSNLQMQGIQNRQIYRGTQVEEDDLRGYDSLMNITRSSKSSTKTKLPRNYLAVNDFINSSSTQRRPQ